MKKRNNRTRMLWTALAVLMLVTVMAVAMTVTAEAAVADDVAELRDTITKAQTVYNGYINVRYYTFTYSEYTDLRALINDANALVARYDDGETLESSEVRACIDGLITGYTKFSAVVQFNASTNGGKLESTSTVTLYYYPIDADLNAVVDLTGFVASREEYEFVGWSTDVNGKSGVKDTITVNGGARLYAIYRKQATNATFQYYSASNNVITTEVAGYLYNNETVGTYTFPLLTTIAQNKSPVVNSKYYSFSGWRSDDAAEPAEYDKQAKTFVGAEGQTFYAVYTSGNASAAVATFDTKGGSAVASVTAYDHISASGNRNTSLFVFTEEPTLEGFVFQGWATADNSDVVVYKTGDTVNSETSMTLYAVWECDHTGGTASCTVQADCEKCDDSYGDLAAHNFLYGYLDHDDTHHWYACPDCNAPSANKVAHSLSSQKGSDESGHWDRCYLCYAAVGNIEAHTEQITNEADGTHDKVCSVCSKLLAEDIGYYLNSDTGYYEINNAAGLLWFAEQVNGGNTTISGILTADIDLAVLKDSDDWTWTPIGATTDGFTGTLNGNGHTVTGLLLSTAGSPNGLIQVLGVGGRVENLEITGTVIGSTSNGMAALVGTNRGTVENCINSAHISSSGAIGGLVGVNYGTVKNCHNTGSIITSTGSAGGVVWDNKGTVTGCSNTGDITGAAEGEAGGIVALNGTSATSSGAIVENCFNTGAIYGGNAGGIVGYGGMSKLIGSCYNTGPVTGVLNVGGIVGHSAGVITSCYSTGEVVNGGNEYTHVGGIVGLNQCTVLRYCYYTDESVDIIGLTSGGCTPTNCGTVSSLTTTLAEALNKGVVGTLHTFAAGSDTTPAVLTGETNSLAWFYPLTQPTEPDTVIDSAQELANLAWYVNNGKNYAGVAFTLSQDIDLGGLLWTPIGTWDGFNGKTFKGTFDGAGHTISGLYLDGTADYQGLFGAVSGATLKNLTVSGTVTGGSHVAGIVALGTDNTTVDNCHNSATVTGASHVGGIVGNIQNGTVINCSNTGDITSSSNLYGAGGIVGFSQGTVQNCYNAGTVSGTGTVGGIVGYNMSGVVQNCYTVTGPVTYNDTADTNCYEGTGPVTYNGIANVPLLTALNAWVEAQSRTDLRTWAVLAGTDYDHPVHHDHILVLSASGAVIRETCDHATEDCGYNETATLTPPTGAVYNGSAHSATVTYSDGWRGGELTVTYEGTADNGTDYAVTGPIDIGDVTAAITVGGATAEIDYAIICPHSDIDSACKCTVCSKDMVAKVDSQYYETFADAVAAACENSGTVVMVANASVNEIIIVNGKTFAIDMQGKTITFGDNSTYQCKLRIEDGTTLTISGGGEIVIDERNGYPNIIEVHGSTLITYDGNFRGQITAYYNGSVGADVTIYGGTYLRLTLDDHSSIKAATGYGLLTDGAPLTEFDMYEVYYNVTLTPIPVVGDIQTGSNAVIYGDTASLSVSATLSGGTPTYQWYMDGNAIAGATGNSYTLPAGMAIGEYSFYCAVYGNGFTVNSNTFTVTVEAKALPGTLTVTVNDAAHNGTARYGDKLTAVYDGEGSYSYQWYRSGVGADTPISGATEAVYTLTAADVGYGVYAVVVGNGNYTGSKTSATLTVNKADLTAELFSFTPPANPDACDGLAKEATVTLKDGIVGVGGITIKYFKGETELTGAPKTVGTYTVKITVAEGANYNSATLTAEAWTFTFDIADEAAHTGLTLKSNANGTHDKVCTVCEKVIESGITCSGTTTDDCDKGYKCSCGSYFGTKEHDFSGNYLSDTEGHWHKCAVCDAIDEKVKHTGGTATCTAKAKCEVCQTEYGEMLKHSYTIPQKDTTDHWNKCAACDAIDEKVKHSGTDDGDCTTAVVCSCGHIITEAKTGHTGGTATCTAKAKCEVCDTEYGEMLKHSYTVPQKDTTDHWNKCASRTAI